MDIRYNLIFKIALPALVLACGTIVVLSGNSHAGNGQAGNSQAAQAAPGASRPALTVRTTTLREDKWARTLAANGSIIP